MLTFGGGVQEVQRELIAMFGGLACRGFPMTEELDERAERIRAEADRIIAMGECSEMVAPYDVHPSTIGNLAGREWATTTRGSATATRPPSMYQVWTMPGLAASGRPRTAEPDDGLLTDAATPPSSAPTASSPYERYLRVGERPRVTNALESVAGPRTPRWGVGYFVTSKNVCTSTTADGTSEKVAEMLFPAAQVHPKERS